MADDSGRRPPRRRHIHGVTIQRGLFVVLCLLVGDAREALANWAATRKANAGALVHVTTTATRPNGDIEVSEGTAFIIDPDGYALTCAHVVPKAPDGASIKYSGSVGGRSTEMHELEVVEWLSPLPFDLALVRLLGPPPGGWPTMELDPGDRIAVDMELFALGFPPGPEIHGVEGKISGVLPDGSWSMTAPIAAGSSGGPVFSRSGGVIGVARGLVENSENYLMLPIAWARGLIAKAPKARLRRAGSSTFTKVLVGAVGAAVGGAGGYAASGRNTEIVQVPGPERVVIESSPSFYSARFEPSSLPCPDGSSRVPIQVRIELRADNRSSGAIRLTGGSAELIIVRSDGLTTEVGQTLAVGDMDVLPSQLGPNTSGVAVSANRPNGIECSNDAGGPFRQNEWLGVVTVRYEAGQPPSPYVGRVLTDNRLIVTSP